MNAVANPPGNRPIRTRTRVAALGVAAICTYFAGPEIALAVLAIRQPDLP